MPVETWYWPRPSMVTASEILVSVVLRSSFAERAISGPDLRCAYFADALAHRVDQFCRLLAGADCDSNAALAAWIGAAVAHEESVLRHTFDELTVTRANFDEY